MEHGFPGGCSFCHSSVPLRSQSTVYELCCDELRDLFAKAKSFTAQQSYTLNDTVADIVTAGFSSSAWRHCRDNKTKKIDIGTLAGVCNSTRLDKGPSSNRGFRGLMNLMSAVKRGEVKMGKDAAASMFHNRVIITIDPGQENLAGITLTLTSVDTDTGIVTGSFKRKMVSRIFTRWVE